ncbi:MAG: hypothetical protein ACI97A_001679 [Planctomycetota bacterium]|jgi:hypothetical protein
MSIGQVLLRAFLNGPSALQCDRSSVCARMETWNDHGRVSQFGMAGFALSGLPRCYGNQVQGDETR